MKIVENLAEWQAAYQAGWLAHLQKTGTFDWGLYPRPNNKSAPAGPAIDLSRHRLIFISTAGGYLEDSQPAFDAANPLGDYSTRLYPADTAFKALAFAHDHYDHQAVGSDPQVLVPLDHLADMVREGTIGELAGSVISYSGYQPDITRIVDELIPAILEAVRAEQAGAALLVPA